MSTQGFDRWAAIGKFDHIDATVQTHLKSVYSCLFIALLSATAGAYVNTFMGFMQEAGFLTAIASIGLIFWMKATPHEQKNVPKRIGMLAGIGALTGMSMGPLLRYAAFLDPSIITTAFMGACVIFGSFTLAALFSRERAYLYLGGTLMSVVGWMMLASFANLILGSTIIFQAQVYIGLVVFCLFVLYDTQMIIEKRRMGDDDFIWHSVDLFFDFIQIFQKLLIILSQKEENKKKRRN